MKDMFDLSGKTALITGGIGGIGQAAALALADRGVDIAVMDRDIANFAGLKNELDSRGVKAMAVAADVTQENEVQAAVDQIVLNFVHIDILLNAAGINIRKPALTFPIDEWKKVQDVNVTGTFICSKIVGSVMSKQGGGKIINCSSVRGRFGGPADITAYCTSKGAIDNLTRTLACELAKYKILVNAIAPTVIETNFTREYMQNPQMMQQFAARTPLGRWGKTDDLLGALIFFSAPASDFITGQILYIDGGLTTWV